MPATLAATVANTYFQILSLKELIDQASRIAQDARRILSLVELQKSGGTAAELLVQQQRNVAATFAAAVPGFQLQLNQNEHLLAVLAGVRLRAPSCSFVRRSRPSSLIWTWPRFSAWSETVYPAGEVAGELFSVQPHAHRF